MIRSDFHSLRLLPVFTFPSLFFIYGPCGFDSPRVVSSSYPLLRRYPDLISVVHTPRVLIALNEKVDIEVRRSVGR